LWFVVAEKHRDNMRVYKKVSGTIVSPNYPNHYGNNERQTYYIVGPKHGEIVLIFLDFDVEYSDYCDYDSLTAS